MDGWVLLHETALGDLSLALRLALEVCRQTEAAPLDVVSHVDPGRLDGCAPMVRRIAADAVQTHWLYRDDDEPAPAVLRALVTGRHVLSLLGAPDMRPQVRLAALEPAVFVPVDPRPRPGIREHILRQWWQRAAGADGHPVPDGSAAPAQERGATPVLDAGAAPVLPEWPALRVREDLRRRGEAALARAGSPPQPVLIHGGSGGRGKCWPLDAFVAVGRELRRAERPVAFVVGPAEEERWEPGQLAALAAEFPLLRSPPPDDLAGCLAAGRVLLSGDCGPAHLAALLGTPTVTLFGPTLAEVWRPAGPRAQALQGDAQLDPQRWGLGVEQVTALTASALAT